MKSVVMSIKNIITSIATAESMRIRRIIVAGSLSIKLMIAVVKKKITMEDILNALAKKKNIAIAKN